MKTLLILVCLGFYTLTSNAQKEEAIIIPAKDTIVSDDTKYTEERLIRQEQEMQALKRDNEYLKKEMKQLKSAFNMNGKSRFTISRRGSKQVIAE